MKYKAYWNVENTKKLLAVIWGFGVVIIATYLILYWQYSTWHTKWKEYFYLNIFTSGFYILVAFVTYGFIFHKYRQSVALRKRTTAYGNHHTDPRTAFSFKSRFYIPVLIILTFILFYLVPVLLGAIKFERAKNYNQLKFLTYCVIQFGATSDAIIYIFLEKPVRNKLHSLIICRSS